MTHIHDDAERMRLMLVMDIFEKPHVDSFSTRNNP